MRGRAYVINIQSSRANNVVAIHLQPGKKISPYFANLLGINR